MMSPNVSDGGCQRLVLTLCDGEGLSVAALKDSGGQKWQPRLAGLQARRHPLRHPAGPSDWPRKWNVVAPGRRSLGRLIAQTGRAGGVLQTSKIFPWRGSVSFHLRVLPLRTTNYNTTLREGVLDEISLSWPPLIFLVLLITGAQRSPPPRLNRPFQLVFWTVWTTQWAGKTKKWKQLR